MYKNTIQSCSSIKLISNIQFVKADDNKLFFVADSLNIYYCDNYVLFQLPQYYGNSTQDSDKGGDTIALKVKHMETKYGYVIYNKKNKYGYRFESLNVDKPQKISVDSFLTIKAYKGFPFYSEHNDSLITSTRNVIKHTLVEKHIYKKKNDASYSDSIYYYYKNGFKNIEYSFSTKLDSSRNLKLYKVRFIYNTVPKGNHNLDIPRREFLFEINNNNSRCNDIINFVNQFKVKEILMP